jgi:hypothetical protein
VVAVVAAIAAMVVPMITSGMAGMRVRAAARLVERELQTARLRSVSTNRPMRVHFNCPSTGSFRMVELLGTPSVPAPADAASAAATRCSGTAYPYPDPNKDWFDVPNNDGPVNQLDAHVVFTAAQSLEFWPDGTVHIDTGGAPWLDIPAGSVVTIRLQQATGSSLEKAATERSIEVNGVGKIALQ